MDLFVQFIKNTLGCLNNPYVTYRRLSMEEKNRKHVFFVGFFAVSYFAFASFIRIGKSYPYLLTIHFYALVLAASFSFFSIVSFLWFIGKLVRTKTSLKTLMILWAYSLLPTISWLFLTSFLYLVLPPPRSDAFLGKVFSIVFLTLTLSLLLWKLILYYLTLRFGLRLDLYKIILTTIFLLPVVSGLAIIFYTFRIFRIPFL